MAGLGTPAIPSTGSGGGGGSVTQGTSPWVVSGTVTANQGTNPWASSLTDGTNIANILKSDGTAVGQNAQIVTGTFLSISATPQTTATTNLIASTDVGNYRAFSWHGDNGASGVNIVAQGSDDNVQWGSLNWSDPTNWQNNGTGTGSSNEIRMANIFTRYIRIQLQGISGGTQGGKLVLYTQPFSIPTAGTSSFKIQDTNSNSYLSAANGLNSTGTGILPSQIVAQLDDTSPTTITENQFGNVRMSADRGLYTSGQARSSEITAVSNAATQGFVTDLVGKQIVLPYANPENFVSGRATATDTTSTSLIGAPALGLRNYITHISVWNSSAVNTYIKIQDGSGGTELYDLPCPATGGATFTLPTPLRQPTTATAIFFAANASANAVFVSASGYKGV